MKLLHINNSDYNVAIMFAKNLITFSCRAIEGDEDYKGKVRRTYDLPKKEVIRTEFSEQDWGRYIHIYFEDNTFWQIKLESAHEIVLDHFQNNGELITEIGAWDFYE